MHGHDEQGTTLQGERLVLRPLEIQDVGEAYVRWMNDPAINRFLESRWDSHDEASLAAFVSRVSADPDSFPFAIVRRDSGAHIGNIKLGPIDRHHLTGSMGILIGDRDSWGKGFGTEAIRLLVAFAFEDLGLHKLTAGCYGPNVESIRAFEKAGFAVESVRPNHYAFEDGYVDAVLLGLVNDAEERG